MKTFEKTLYSALNKAFSAVTLQPQNTSRILDVHPSGLPFCGYSFLYNWLMLKGLGSARLKDELTLGTGTHFHETLEKYMGMENGNMYGVWTCSNCGKEVITGLKPEDPICPHCHTEYSLKYNELGINYKGVVGHVDTIMQDSKGNFWVVDYKTTSLNKLKEKSQDPGSVYKAQILSYALLLKLQYNLTIKGVCLLFVAKENPALENTSTWMHLVTEEDIVNVRGIIKEARYLKHYLTRAKTWEDIKDLPLHRCDNPWCPVCPQHSENEIRKILRNLVRENSQYLPIIKVVQQKELNVEIPF